MTYYCSVADVGMRLGLDSAQRTRATSRITSCVRRASIKIDQCFLDYGRNEPSKSIGVTGLSFDHASGVAVQEGQMAHVLREICADIASGLYMEDEATHQNSGDLRGKNLRERGYDELQRLAHLGQA